MMLKVERSLKKGINWQVYLSDIQMMKYRNWNISAGIRLDLSAHFILFFHFVRSFSLRYFCMESAMRMQQQIPNSNIQNIKLVLSLLFLLLSGNRTICRPISFFPFRSPFPFAIVAIQASYCNHSITFWCSLHIFTLYIARANGLTHICSIYYTVIATNTWSSLFE